MTEKTGLESIENASRDEITAVQLERLRWSLRHAYDNVAHYRRAFDDAGIRPDDLRSLADLARFPFTTKQDLRENYPFKMFAVPREKVVRVHASSGTTGKPTVVGYTQNDVDMWARLMARSIHASGGRPGDILHVSYGYGLFTGGLGAHYGAERLGCTVIPFGGGQTERQVQLIQDFEPDIIMVTPSYMLAIGDEFVRQGLDPAKCSLRLGIHGAEPWTQQMREEIERRFDMDAVDIYGLSEVIGPGVANECVESKDGPVVWEDHFYPEIVDPATGQVLPDGELGELVFTSLTKEALPRRQCLPLADRRAHPQDPKAFAALPDRGRSRRPSRHGDAQCRDAARARHRHRRREGLRRQRTGASHQVLHRHFDARRDQGGRHHRALGRQGQAGGRSPAALTPWPYQCNPGTGGRPSERRQQRLGKISVRTRLGAGGAGTPCDRPALQPGAHPLP